jgi:hypothetical protein
MKEKIKKILNLIAIFLSIIQIGFVIYFLTIYTTDNMPLFIFIFFAPLVSILAIVFNKK